MINFHEIELEHFDQNYLTRIELEHFDQNFHEILSEIKFFSICFFFLN